MLIPQNMLVITVDGQNARLLRNGGSATTPRFEIVDERHSDIPPDRDLMADRPGRSFASAAPVRHAYQEDSVHDRAEGEFAVRAMDMLDGGNAAGDPVVLIAPPQTLGILRAKMPQKHRDRITHEINKDLNAYTPQEICTFLIGYEPATG